MTDNLEFTKEILFSNTPNTKIVSLDEDGALPLDHPNVLGGTCLLPPVDAMIAEEDGNEALYDAIYTEIFDAPFLAQYVGALVIYLFNGGNLLLYVPDLNSNTAKELRNIFWKRYGIGIGVMGQVNMFLDNSCIPMWLEMIYGANAMSPIQFLYLYPEKVVIQPPFMDKLLTELSPFGKTYQDKMDYIMSLVHKLKEKPNLVIPIYKVA